MWFKAVISDLKAPQSLPSPLPRMSNWSPTALCPLCRTGWRTSCMHLWSGQLQLRSPGPCQRGDRGGQLRPAGDHIGGLNLDMVDLVEIGSDTMNHPLKGNTLAIWHGCQNNAIEIIYRIYTYLKSRLIKNNGYHVNLYMFLATHQSHELNDSSFTGSFFRPSGL